MGKAHLNPLMLRWAIERADAQLDDLGAAFKKAPESIESWLDGSDAPTFKQAQKLAKRLRIPFGYLFLESPPDEDLPLPDFRRVRGSLPRETSIDLREVISDVLRKQDWYRDHRLECDEEPVELVGRFTLTSSVQEIAEDIGSHLDFETVVRPKSRLADFLRAFVGQVEELGILVMRNGVVRQSTNRPLKVDEFRGFSVADPMAPVVFVNNVDSNAAQAFTLAHELAHIWIGQGGISDADFTIVAEASSDIESFCNEVAGELLLPWKSLSARWSTREGSPEEFVKTTARQYHVSTVMVARQLWAYRAIEREQFFEVYETERVKWNTKTASLGGDFYKSASIRNSRVLTEAVLESVRASETSIRDASRLLGVKPANLPKLQESMGVT